MSPTLTIVTSAQVAHGPQAEAVIDSVAKLGYPHLHWHLVERDDPTALEQAVAVVFVTMSAAHGEQVYLDKPMTQAFQAWQLFHDCENVTLLVLRPITLN